MTPWNYKLYYACIIHWLVDVGAWKEQLCVTFPWIKNPLRLDETNEVANTIYIYHSSVNERDQVPQIVRVKYR